MHLVLEAVAVTVRTLGGFLVIPEGMYLSKEKYIVSDSDIPQDTGSQPISRVQNSRFKIILIFIYVPLNCTVQA
jgi:hypothetical protein